VLFKFKDLSKNLILFGLVFFAIFAGIISQNSFGKIEVMAQVTSTSPILFEGKTTYVLLCPEGLAGTECKSNQAKGCEEKARIIKCADPGTEKSTRKEVQFKKEDCGGDQKSYCASKDGVLYQDCSIDGICRNEAPKTDGKYYQVIEHSGNKCRIYLTPNGYYSGNVSGSGKVCNNTDPEKGASDPALDQKCIFLNPNEKSAFGQKNIQLGCEAKTYNEFSGGGQIAFWDKFSGDGSGRTVVIRLNSGEQITLSDADLAGFCGGGVAVIGDPWWLQCKSSTKENFLKKLQEFCKSNGKTNCSNIKDPEKEITKETVAGDTTKIDTSGDSSAKATVSDKTAEPLDGVGDAAGKALNGAINLILTLVIVIITAIAWVLGAFGLILTFFLSMLTLMIMMINPASNANIVVAAEVWGIFAGIANLIAFGSIVFFGLMKVLDVKNYSDRNVGDFILKVIFYAVLINFTLLTTAALVNIGYSFGILLIVSRGGDPNNLDSMAQILMGDILKSIARFSYIRCGKVECEAAGFKATSEVSSRGFGDIFSPLGSGFDKALGPLVGNAIGELLFFFILVIAIGALIKLFKVALYRLIAVWVLMITSPVALASYFSGIEEWQTFGKQWLERLITSILFFPAVIFALIMISLMSGAFGNVINSSAIFATSSTAKSITSSSVSVSSQDFGSYGDNFNKTIQFVVDNIIAGAFTIGGLYAVAGYFEDKFKGDVEAVKAGAGEIWQGAKDVAYKNPASALARGVGSVASKTKYGKKFSAFADKQLNNLSKSGPFGSGRLAAGVIRGAGRLTKDTLSGRVLDLAESKIGTLKALTVDSLSNIKKKDIEGRIEEDKIRDVAFLKRLPGIGNTLGYYADNSGSLPFRGATGKDLDDLDKISKNGELYTESKARDTRSEAERKIINDENVIDEDLQFKRLKDISEALEKGKYNDEYQDLLVDLINKSYGNNKLFEAIAVDKNLSEKVGKLKRNGGFNDKASKEIEDNYLALASEKEKEIQSNAKRDASDFSEGRKQPSSANLLNETYRKQFEERLKEISGEDSKDYRRYESVKQAAQEKGARALDNLGRDPKSNNFVNQKSANTNIQITTDQARNISNNSNIDLTQNYDSETDLDQVINNSTELKEVFNQATTESGGNRQAGYEAVQRSLNVAKAVNQANINNFGVNHQVNALEQLKNNNYNATDQIKQKIGFDLVKDLIIEDLKTAVYESYVAAGRGANIDAVSKNATYQKKAEESAQKAYREIIKGDNPAAEKILDRAGGQAGVAAAYIRPKGSNWLNLAKSEGEEFLKDNNGNPLTPDQIQRKHEQLKRNISNNEENAAKNANRANPKTDPRNI
jgi:hypothetical protein